MKKICYLILFYGCTLVYSADSLRISNNEYDFGKVLSDSTFSYAVEITNVSDKVVKIKDVRATCGCTVPMVDDKILKPGMETKLKIQFDSGSFRGAQRKFVYIYTDTGDKYRLAFNAFVIGKFEITPEFLKLKGKDFPFTKKVVVKSNTDKKEFLIEKLQSGNGIGSSIVNENSFNIKIENSLDLKHENEVMIYIKGEKSPLIFKVFFSKELSIKMTPKTIPFLNLKRDKAVSKTATLFCDNLSTVESVVPDVKWIKFKDYKKLDGRIVLSFVTIPEKMTKGFGKSYILVKIKNKQGDVNEIKWPVIFNVF